MATRQKTVLRTIRISKDLDDLLKQDANEKRLTYNSLVSNLLTKYAEWDRIADRFRMISISKEIFQALLEGSDQARIAKIGRRLGGRIPKEAILFWFKRVTLETFVAGLSNFCRYGHIAECQVESGRGGYTIVLHHEMGSLWTIFLREYLKRAAASQLGTTPMFETSHNSLLAHLPGK